MANRPCACPFCHSQNVRILDSQQSYQVACQQCHSLGPQQKLISQAVFSWNQLPQQHSAQQQLDQLHQQQACLDQLLNELDQLGENLASQMLN